MSGEMQAYRESGNMIQLYREPEVILAEATRAAKALGTVLAAKPKKVMMNGEQYLEFEDWQTVGKFYEVSAKVVSTEFIDFGSAQGFLAKAEVIRLSDGMAISAAEAMCLNDEDKWSARSKYIYEYVLKDGTRQEDDPPKDMIVWVDNPDKPGKKIPQKERVLRGEVKVPLFQLRSMAQTRACAKALRNVLAWVVVLAGYKPTVAEELDGDTNTEENETKPPIKEPQKKAAPQNSTPDASKITEAQAKRFYAIAKGAGKTDDGIHEHLSGLGMNSSRDIPKDQYDAICEWAANKEEREPGAEG